MGIDHTLLKEIECGAAAPPSNAVIHRMAQELGGDAGPLLAAAAEAACERIWSCAVQEPQMQALVRRLAEVDLTGAQIERMLVVVEAGPDYEGYEGFDAGGGRGRCVEYNGSLVTDVTMQKLIVLAAGLVGLAILLV
jgi:hypothetical protein